MLGKKPFLRPLALVISLLFLPGLDLGAQPLDETGAELPATGKTVRRILQSGKATQPVPNASLTVVDPETLNLIHARWEKLLSGINRSHRHEPMTVDVPLEDISPWMPPADTATGARGPVADPFQIEVNGTPSSVAPGGFSSTVNEPSVASVGDYVFFTANWYAAASTDGGTSWSFVNPYVGPFPEPVGEDFCCDQQAAYDDGSNSVLWLQQLIPGTSSANGSQRVNVDQGADGTWDCFYDVTPQDAGFANLTFPDYPDVAVSDSHFFVTSNVFPTNGGGFQGAFVARLPLADITACDPATTDFYTDTGFGSFRMTQNAADVMYFADHQTTTSLRVWSWDENNASPTSVLRTINAFSTGTRSCPGPDARDWCGFLDSRLMGAALAGNRAAFFWVANQNPGGGFPFPYTQGTILDTTNNLAVLEQPLIWSNDAAWVYPSAASNANGDLGGTILWGGGSHFPHCSAWLVDDANGDSFSPFEHEQVIAGTSGPGSNRSGDYLATRTHHPNDDVYGASCFSYLSTGAGTSRFVLFGRQSAFQNTIFEDGFESGNTTAWDTTVP